MGRRGVLGLASAAVVLGLAWPSVAPGEHDSLPLSNYPMFAHPRDSVTTFYAVVLADRDDERFLDLRAVGGTDQPVQAAMTVRQAVRDRQADSLCEEIASRLETPGRVRVLELRFDAPGWFAGEREPVARTVHAECAVGA